METAPDAYKYSITHHVICPFICSEKAIS